ncbi:TraB/GumN family protein [Lacibacter sp.]|uniref:TraB/GumN family protein n=1 Tax=Lacibacter sp. TaxID=1915409 RepID=UPI002B4AB234|nr:TraB/GumN family protein [Lacibacter sp.]HLP38484.1 TraB/GumN family protein [Lacibacter sp.]
MQKLMTSLLASFLFVSMSFGQSAPKSSLLWEITGKDLKQPSYLFGTIHIICKEDFFLPPIVTEKFTNADQIFLELDMDDPMMVLKMMQLLQLPKGQTIKQLFGDSAFKTFDEQYKKITGSSAMMFNTFKPFMLMSMLTEKSLSCTARESYEQTFIAMAAKQKKNIKGLETIEDQVAVFDSIPDSTEIANLKNMVVDFNKGVEEFKKLVAVYKTQDVDSMYRLTNQSPELMEAEEELLVKRNSKWIPIIETNMQQTSCFFAVGAAHLGGDIGVIALLRKQGYTVKPVKL